MRIARKLQPIGRCKYRGAARNSLIGGHSLILRDGVANYQLPKVTFETRSLNVAEIVGNWLTEHGVACFFGRTYHCSIGNRLNSFHEHRCQFALVWRDPQHHCIMHCKDLQTGSCMLFNCSNMFSFVRMVLHSWINFRGHRGHLIYVGSLYAIPVVRTNAHAFLR